MPVNQIVPGIQVAADGAWTNQRGDNFGNLCIQHNGPDYMELTRRSWMYTYSQAAAGTVLTSPVITSLVTTGAFVIGRRYQIAAVGDTDFTLIGAVSSTIGIEFTATGVGGGTTGQANLMNSCPMIWNKAQSSVNFIPTRITMGFLPFLTNITTTVLFQMALYVLPSPGDTSGVITIPTADVGTPVNNFIGKGNPSNVTFAPSAQLLTTLPTFVKAISWNVLVNDLTGKNMAVFEYTFNGKVIVRPNNAVFFGAMGVQAATAILSVEGYEVPIQASGI